MIKYLLVLAILFIATSAFADQDCNCYFGPDGSIHCRCYDGPSAVPLPR